MIAAVIVAAGKGTRMGGRLPKQYLSLQGRPILVHSLAAFQSVEKVDRVVIVLPPGDEKRFERLVLPYMEPGAVPEIVNGGARRQESVYNGLKALPDDIHEEDLVLIHDGARPLVTPELIESCIEGALKWRACLPVLGPSDTVKEISEDGNVLGTLERSMLGLAQTPQAFGLKLIRDAHHWAQQTGVRATDDAALLEKRGVKVKAIQGSADNIKITFAKDLFLAEAILKSRQAM